MNHDDNLLPEGTEIDCIFWVDYKSPFTVAVCYESKNSKGMEIKKTKYFLAEDLHKKETKYSDVNTFLTQHGIKSLGLGFISERNSHE